MCVIIYGKQEVELEILEKSYDLNPHGIGMMWSQNNQLHTWKGMSFKKFYSKYQKLLNLDIYPAIHFRLATVGKVNMDNVHPFKVRKGLAMMHNGTMEIDGYNSYTNYSNYDSYYSSYSKKTPKDTRSDSQVFASNLILSWGQLDELDTNPIYTTIVNGSRLLFMNRYGKVKIINADATMCTVNNDVWYSKNNVIEKMNIPVVVYGTLKRGNGNYYSYLKDSEFIEKVKLKNWKMYTNGSFPAIIKTKNDADIIHGELFRVSQSTLNNLDGLEGFYYQGSAKNHYNRTKVAVKTSEGKTVWAWIYHYDENSKAFMLRNMEYVHGGNFTRSVYTKSTKTTTRYLPPKRGIESLDSDSPWYINNKEYAGLAY